MDHDRHRWCSRGLVRAVLGLPPAHYPSRATRETRSGHTLVGCVCRHRPRSSLSATRFSNVSYARRPGLGLGKSSLLRCALAADGVHPSCKASCCDDSCGSAMHKRFKAAVNGRAFEGATSRDSGSPMPGALTSCSSETSQGKPHHSMRYRDHGRRRGSVMR